jgi:NitT/TauT family transport system substrate-binding protein
MRKFYKYLVALAAVGGLATQAASADPEKQEVTVGLPVATSTLLPIYLAEEEGYFKDEGIDVTLTAFKGGTDMVRGLVAGAVDMALGSLAVVTVGVKAEQPVKAFYGGFNMTVFDWYAVPGIDSIKDAKGKRFGVTTVGSSTDFLTRYALQKSGLEPDKDVQIIQGGGSTPRLAAMEAGQLDVNIFATPEKFMAADAGFNLIYRQADIAPDYPFHVFFTTEDFIKNAPETIKAVLRGVVRGIKLAKSNRERAVKTLVDRLHFDPKYAGRAYDDFIGAIYEDGRMHSDAGMKAFWDVGIESGDYTEAWPTSRYLDSTFIDSYADWKPAD